MMSDKLNVESMIKESSAVLQEDLNRIKAANQEDNITPSVYLDAAISKESHLKIKTSPKLIEAHPEILASYDNLEEVYKKIREKFQTKYGKIIDEIVMDKSSAAAVLTEKGALWITRHIKYDSPLSTYISKSIYQAQRASQHLKGNELVRCNQNFFMIIVHIFLYFDELKSNETSRLKQVDIAQVESTIQELEKNANSILDDALNRWANVLYFLGMLLGAFICALLCGLSVYLLPDFKAMIISLGAGGIGAVISVMNRMTSSNLQLDPNVGRRLLLLFGALRVILGAIFGLAIFTFLNAGIFPVNIPLVEDSKYLWFFASLAFLAGFAERMTKNLVESLAVKLLKS